MVPSIPCHCKDSGTWCLSSSVHMYLDPQLSQLWQAFSTVASFLNCGKLPLHRYGHFHPTVLDDKDFSHGIMLYLLEISKKTSVRAPDIINYVQLPDVRNSLAQV